MSLQWTFIATFLYIEIAVLVLLLLPFISATRLGRWSKILKSRLFSSLGSYAHIYLNIFMVLLAILFIDSIRDVRKYSVPVEPGDMAANPQAETLLHMKLFRAQRNFYIAGFALFLFAVLRRMISLMITTASLEANLEAAHKQAKSATDAAKQMLETQDNKSNDGSEDLKKENAVLSSKIAKLESELKRAETDMDVMRKQAQSTNNEYDRLMKEHSNLQKESEALKGESGSKKDA